MTLLQYGDDNKGAEELVKRYNRSTKVNLLNEDDAMMVNYGVKDYLHTLTYQELLGTTGDLTIDIELQNKLIDVFCHKNKQLVNEGRNTQEFEVYENGKQRTESTFNPINDEETINNATISYSMYDIASQQNAALRHTQGILVEIFGEYYDYIVKFIII